MAEIVGLVSGKSGRNLRKVWHITTATHNSRYSQRMYDYYVKLGESIW